MKRLRLAVPFFLLFACCGSLTGNLPRTPPGWTEHNDPNGFAITHPAGWRVSVSQQNGILLQNPDATAFVVIRPFLLSVKMSPEQWIRTAQVKNPLFPQARLLKIGRVPQRPNEAIASVAFTERNAPWRASMIVSLHGGTGMLFVAAAKSDVYPRVISTLVEALESFHFAEGRTSVEALPDHTLAGIRWTRFTDSRENSFSVEVPAGWQVEGGISRRSSTDVRRVITLSSPNRRIIMFNNDPQLMLYTVPHPTIPIPEGQNYQGWNMARYRSGDQFLREYVPSKLSGICTNVEFEELKARSDIDSHLNRVLLQNGLGDFMQYSFGEAEFTCDCAAAPMMGYYTVGIIRAQGNPGLVNWTPDSLGGFVATPDQFAVAAQVFRHMMSTFRINQNWAAAQRSLTMRTVEIHREASEQIAGMIESAYQHKRGLWDTTNRNFSNAIHGDVDLVAPDGTTYKGVNGSNYYHAQNATGNVHGTDTADPPAYDTEFTALAQW